MLDTEEPHTYQASTRIYGRLVIYNNSISEEPLSVVYPDRVGLCRQLNLEEMNLSTVTNTSHCHHPSLFYIKAGLLRFAFTPQAFFFHSTVYLVERREEGGLVRQLHANSSINGAELFHRLINLRHSNLDSLATPIERQIAIGLNCTARNKSFPLNQRPPQHFAASHSLPPLRESTVTGNSVKCIVNKENGSIMQ